MIGCMAVVMPLTGIVMPKVGHILYWPIVGGLLALAGGTGFGESSFLLLYSVPSLGYSELLFPNKIFSVIFIFTLCMLMYMANPARLEKTTTPLWIYTPQVLVGIGFALYLQMAYTAMPSYAPASQKGNAMAMVIICTPPFLSLPQSLSLPFTPFPSFFFSSLTKLTLHLPQHKWEVYPSSSPSQAASSRTSRCLTCNPSFHIKTVPSYRKLSLARVVCL